METAERREMELPRSRVDRVDELQRSLTAYAAQQSAREAELQGQLPHRPMGFPARVADEETAAAKAEAAATSALRAETEEAALRLSQGVMPPPLRGSLASLKRQDVRLEAEGLQRIEDESDLESRIAHKLLVPLPVSNALEANPALSPLRRYCRPWTAQFLIDLARAHETLFQRPLEVNSAVRTVAYQEKLMRINENAAPAEGGIVSPHVMGATVDIAKKGMSPEELAWMRRVLLALELEGKIDVEEEFEQACFHITVYKNYVPPLRARRWAVVRSEPGFPARSTGPPRPPVQPDPAPSTFMASGSIGSQGQ